MCVLALYLRLRWYRRDEVLPLYAKVTSQRRQIVITVPSLSSVPRLKYSANSLQSRIRGIYAREVQKIKKKVHANTTRIEYVIQSWWRKKKETAKLMFLLGAGWVSEGHQTGMRFIPRSASMHLRLAFQIFTIRFRDFSVSFSFKENWRRDD